MRATAIVALVFASLSIFIPVGGIFIAMLCSIMVMITFRSEPTLSGITFGINILNTAFLSPSIMLADVASSEGVISPNEVTSSGEILGAYIGFHVILLIVAIIWRVSRGKVAKEKGDAHA